MNFLYLIISLVIVLLDQGLKIFITSNFALGQVQQIVPKLLSFTYVQNRGAAWNILTGQMWLFYLISIFAIGVCLYLLFNKKHPNIFFKLGLSLTLGGIIGNFIDRLHLHYVIDMIQLDFINFNIFNLADSAITVGVILIFVYLLFFDGEKDRK